MKKATFLQFDSYACVGDFITWQAEGFDITATLNADSDTRPEDSDCYSKKQIKVWKNDDWFFVGAVLSVAQNGVALVNHAVSLWGIDCNFPSRKKNPNTYLSECAREMESEALERARGASMKTIATYTGSFDTVYVRKFDTLDKARTWARQVGVFDKTTFKTDKMKTETHTMPATWASALINNDRSGLDHSGDGPEFDAYMRANPELRNPVLCGENTFNVFFNGLLTECLEYSFLSGE